MRLGSVVYRGAVAAKDLFERVRFGWGASLAKAAILAISRVARFS
jgi:hypothetical protein